MLNKDRIFINALTHKYIHVSLPKPIYLTLYFYLFIYIYIYTYIFRSGLALLGPLIKDYVGDHHHISQLQFVLI